MGRQLSTVVSDAVLALSAFKACLTLSTSCMTGVLGFLLIGIAASFGVRRFASSQPDYWIVQKHNYTSWLARVLAMSCIASAYYRSVYNYYTMANLHIAAGLAAVFVQYINVMSQKYLNMVTEVVSSGAVISTLVYCIIAINPYGIIGTVLYAIAGLYIGTAGRMRLVNFWVLRVDIFHYLLAVGNIALLMGLVQSSEPIFFSRS